jgi:hypothetical protein
VIDGANRARGRGLESARIDRLDPCNLRAYRQNCLLEIAVFGARLRHLTLSAPLASRQSRPADGDSAARNPICPAVAGIANLGPGNCVERPRSNRIAICRKNALILPIRETRDAL